MKKFIVVFGCISFFWGFVLGDELSVATNFKAIAKKKGEEYRQAVAAVVGNPHAPQELEAVLRQEPENVVNVRNARILLAHINHPEVFEELTENIQKWRELRKEESNSLLRQGFFSGLLLKFINEGVESKFVHVHDLAADKEWMDKHPEGSVMISGIHRKKVEKYTDAEVEAGIARNAAARQAVLEYFLKFLEECDTYEQKDLVDLVFELWGPLSVTQSRDLTVIDHVPDAVALIETVMNDDSRPVDVRLRAGYHLYRSKPEEVRAFMMGLVTHIPLDEKGQPRKDIVSKALDYLEYMGDLTTLDELREISNAPPWKVDLIHKAIPELERSISIRKENMKKKEELLQGSGASTSKPGE